MWDMTSLFNQYPALQRLQDWAAERDLSITVENSEPDPISVDAVTLKIGSPGKPDIHFTVFDEYRDARHDNILLSLTLIEMEFGELDDATHVTSWARANGLDSQNDGVRDVYLTNTAAQSAFVEMYGSIPDAISTYDWSLNAGAAQALRAANTKR